MKKRDSNHLPSSAGNIQLTRTKFISQLSNGQTPTLPSTPMFNLQLFDDSDEFQSDDNEDKPQRRGTTSSRRTEDDDDEEEEEDASMHPLGGRSQSLEGLSTRSSIAVRKRVDTTRDFANRRHALDPGAANNLRSYVRHRKDSIVQRVIGYNYDDHSTAGGLYIRVGIGSKGKRRR